MTPLSMAKPAPLPTEVEAPASAADGGGFLKEAFAAVQDGDAAGFEMALNMWLESKMAAVKE